MTRLMIIEDEPTIAMVLKEVLSEEGYVVSTALNGLTAMEQMRVPPQPDIVIADLLMPGMSGRAIVKAMRADDRLKMIPVIIISGAVPHTEDFPPEGTYQAFIKKPFDLMEVLETVKKLLCKQADK